MVWTQEIGGGSALTVLDDAPDPSDETAALAPESDLARSLPIYQQIMGLDREAAPAMIAAGLIQSAEGNNAAAEWLLRRSLKVAATVVAHNTLGHILLGRRDWDGALVNYRASLAIDPTNTTTWPNLLFARLAPRSHATASTGRTAPLQRTALPCVDGGRPAARERPGPRAAAAGGVRFGRFQAALCGPRLRAGADRPRPLPLRSASVRR